MPSRRDTGARPGSRPSSRSQSRRPTRRDGIPPKRRTATPTVPTAPAKQPGPARPRGSRNLTGRAAVVLLVLGALIVSYAQSLRVWFDQHQQISALHQEIRDRDRRVAHLDDELSRWEDDAYVRAQARQRLGWVMPGEVGYRVIGADGKPVGAPPPPAGGDDPLADRPPAWYAKLWGSVEGAGRTPQEAPTEPAKPTPKPILTPPTKSPR